MAPDPDVLRRRMRAELPESTFTKKPARMAWAMPLAAIAVLGIVAILVVLEQAWFKLIVAVLVAHALGGLAFMAHEVLHGAMGGTRRLQNAVAWMGLGALLTPPEFWRTWHNRMHHGHTNHKVRDLDHFGTVSRHQKRSMANRLMAYAPGTGHPLSLLFCFYSFSLHAQILLWTATHRHPVFKSRSWVTEKVQSIVLLLCWIGLAIYSGWDAVYTVLIPFLGANVIIQSYIVTNHWLRPHTQRNHPLENTLSLLVPEWLDRLHFRFSHHVEHHMLPGVSSVYLPRVRCWLQKEVPGELALARHAEAIRWLYRTPRTYQSNAELAWPESPERVFDLGAFGAYLKSPIENRVRLSDACFWIDKPLPKVE